MLKQGLIDIGTSAAVSWSVHQSVSVQCSEPLPSMRWRLLVRNNYPTIGFLLNGQESAS